MFESVEIRKAKNGFVIAVNEENETEEFVFDSPRKVIKFIKEFVETKDKAAE